MTAAVELLVVAWLPGAAIFRAPVLGRERRASLDAEERLFWQVVIAVATSLSVLLALAAANRYSFARLLWADGAIAAVVAVASRLRLRYAQPGAPRPGLSALVPLALVLLGLWRFFPASEYVIGGKDPGVYMNEGIQIAQRGTLSPADAVVAAVPNFARDLFFPSEHRDDYYSGRFMGFFIREPEQGHVIGQFPHLYPASIAIGYGLDGVTGARRTTGVWAVLGLLAVYFAGARLFGKPAAAAAACLLSLHVIEVWFSRYPNAEVVMQALLFAAVLAAARSHVDGDRFFAPVGGFLLGLLLFLRFDAVLGIAGVGAGLALAVVAGRRVQWPFVAALLTAAVLAAVYLLGPMRAYAYLPIVWVSSLSWWQDAAIGVLALAGLAALGIGARVPALTSAVRRGAPVLLAAIVCAAAVYALYFRQPGGKLTAYDAYALRTFTYVYYSVPAFLAALFGYALTTRQKFWRDPALFLIVATFGLFFFYKVRIVPEHFWMARRFLPVILPGALLFTCAAALAGTASGQPRVRLLRGALGAAFLALLALQYARVARPLLEHVEYAGIIPRLERIAAAINPDDLLIVESRDASDTHVLALPLAYIYDRNVLLLRSRLPDKAMFAPFLDWARTKYGRVLFMGGGGTDLLSSKWDVTPVAGERFQVPEYETSRSGLPRTTRQKEFDYSVYEFVPPADSLRPLDVDIGTRDDLHVLRFHAKESVGGRSFRWSRDASYVSFAALPSSARTVTIWMDDGGRPPAAPPAEVTVSLQVSLQADQPPSIDRPLGTVRVLSGFKPYVFEIPQELGTVAASGSQPIRLKLSTSVWSPQRTLGTGDDREVGVMVDRVAVQ